MPFVWGKFRDGPLKEKCYAVTLQVLGTWGKAGVERVAGISVLGLPSLTGNQPLPSNHGPPAGRVSLCPFSWVVETSPFRC